MTSLRCLAAGLLVLLALVETSVGHKTYHGYQVWRMRGTTDNLQGLLSDCESSSLPLDVWASGIDWVDVAFDPITVKKHLRAKLQQHDVKGSVIIRDLQRSIESQKMSRSLQVKEEFDLETFHTYDEIVAQLSNISASDDRVSMESIGSTLGGRGLWMVTVTVGGAGTKPAVWIDCGIHAREWITPATCMWMLTSMLSLYGQDESVTSLLDTNDIYMLPVMNADGYDYSWTDDRMWRKNRHVYEGELCEGVDLNRNYNGTNWGGIGSSDSHCSDTYHGESPLSEAENTAASQQLEVLAAGPGGLKASFSLHSYGALWLFAYGWTSDLPADVDEMYRVANIGVDAIETVNGNSYTPGPHYETIYPSTGTVVDYGYEVIGTPHAYIIESEDHGNGFLLPESLIAETAQEVWMGVLASVLAA